jgi:anti-sigma regulatory factor (Ser/Thr protein kinase)
MEVGATVRVSVAEGSQVFEARRVATALARDLQFEETTSGKLAIVVTEIATNLLKHAGGGEILLRPIRSDAVGGLEILGLDRGQGMSNVEESLRDGQSTAGSPGTGLGAIGRLSDAFDIYSVPGQGTAVFSRLWATRLAAREGPPLAVGGICLTHPGEQHCGDGWTVEHRRRSSLLLVVDGLGHGAAAAEATHEAIRLFHQNVSLGPKAMIEVIHAGLRSTRGAAAAVTEIDWDPSLLRFAGVGNISGVIRSATGSRHVVSQNGTIGHTVRKVTEFSYPWSADAILVEHTDGLGTHWDLDRYPGLAQRDPTIVAGVLCRDFRRGRDDVTVVAARARMVMA